jgi:hypothetical protein
VAGGREPPRNGLVHAGRSAGDRLGGMAGGGRGLGFGGAPVDRGSAWGLQQHAERLVFCEGTRRWFVGHGQRRRFSRGHRWWRESFPSYGTVLDASRLAAAGVECAGSGVGSGERSVATRRSSVLRESALSRSHRVRGQARPDCIHSSAGMTTVRGSGRTVDVCGRLVWKTSEHLAYRSPKMGTYVIRCFQHVYPRVMVGARVALSLRLSTDRSRAAARLWHHHKRFAIWTTYCALVKEDLAPSYPHASL